LEGWWWAIWQGSAGITTNAILMLFSTLPTLYTQVQTTAFGLERPRWSVTCSTTKNQNHQRLDFENKITSVWTWL
jgi:hypothetical protein